MDLVVNPRTLEEFVLCPEKVEHQELQRTRWVKTWQQCSNSSRRPWRDIDQAERGLASRTGPQETASSGKTAREAMVQAHRAGNVVRLGMSGHVVAKKTPQVKTARTPP